MGRPPLLSPWFETRRYAALLTMRAKGAALTRPQLVRFQKLRHGPVERRRVLDAAGVAGAGQHDMPRARDHRGGFAAALQRHVMRAVDDQRRRFHARQPFPHVAGFTRPEDLRDAWAVELLRLVGEEIEHPCPELGV